VNKETHSYGFEATGQFPSGSIFFINDSKFLNDGCNRLAVITPDPARQLSLISQGAKGSLFSRGRTKDGKISEWAIALAYLAMPEKPEFLREKFLTGSQWALIIKNRYQHSSDGSDHSECQFNDYFKKFIGNRIVDLIERHGSKGLHELAQLLELIEKKSEISTSNSVGVDPALTLEEQDFCTALERETCAIEDVPNQKQVREAWLSMRRGRNEDQFRRVRDRLGFRWLPAAKRGKNRI
jgi:hypothetical protein